MAVVHCLIVATIQEAGDEISYTRQYFQGINVYTGNHLIFQNGPDDKAYDAIANAPSEKLVA